MTYHCKGCGEDYLEKPERCPKCATSAFEPHASREEAMCQAEVAARPDVRQHQNPPQHPSTIGACRVPRCGGVVLCRGVCRFHYDQGAKYNDPVVTAHWLPKSTRGGRRKRAT